METPSARRMSRCAEGLKVVERFRHKTDSSALKDSRWAASTVDDLVRTGSREGTVREGGIGLVLVEEAGESSGM